MKCCIYLLAIFVEQAEKMTLVALEGSAYPSELCPKGCKRDENGIFSNILATKQKWVKLAIFWSVWDIVGCISWNVKKSTKSVPILFIPFPRTAFDVLNRSEIKVLCEKSVIDF